MTTPTRILLIDDDAVDRASVRRALAKSGLAHTLTEAAGGDEGLRLAAEASFDCVLLDYRLPGVDTFALLRTLLSAEGEERSVMVLTGEADGELATRLMRTGALDFLAKAEVTPSGLARAIRYAEARRGFQAELAAARREAEAKSLELDTLNRQKSLLFSIIAHDLRNPFQALLGLSEVLGRAVAARDHASVERRAKGIHEAATQAYALLESLFSWASLQMDTMAVTLTEVDFGALAGEVMQGAAEAAADKGLNLTVSCDRIAVRAQRDMLGTVLRNLVSNAIKFTLPGGTVTVAGRRDGDEVEISVADTGVGMPPGKVDDLFRLDRRTTTNGTAGERGSGLGLLLCRDLVERLGGVLTVASVVDEGTTFRFRLPAGGGCPDVGSARSNPGIMKRGSHVGACPGDRALRAARPEILRVSSLRAIIPRAVCFGAQHIPHCLTETHRERGRIRPVRPGHPLRLPGGEPTLRNDGGPRVVASGTVHRNHHGRMFSLPRHLLLALIVAAAPAGHALAAEDGATSPPPMANGRPPIAGAPAPGKAATQAVTDPTTVPPSERVPGAGTKPESTGVAPPDARR